MAQQREPARQITPISGDLYRASNGAWPGIFLVTPEGIVLADPLNTPFATRSKQELATRDASTAGIPILTSPRPPLSASS